MAFFFQNRNEIKLPEPEWEIAQQFFKDNPHKSKLTYHQDNITRSFLNINNTLYALKNNVLGSTHPLTLAQDSDGHYFALKAKTPHRSENRAPSLRQLCDLTDTDVYSLVDEKCAADIIEAISRLESISLETKEDACKIPDQIEPSTLQKLYHGEMLKNKIRLCSDIQKLDIAIKLLEDIHSLHKQHIIHCHINQESVFLDDDLHVISIDEGFSCQSTKDFIIKKDKYGNPIVIGKMPYISLEVRQQGCYSYASDVFALGMTFKHDFNLADFMLPEVPHLITQMCETDPLKRPSVTDAIVRLKKVHAKLLDQICLSQTTLHRFIAQLKYITTINKQLIGELKQQYAELNNEIVKLNKQLNSSTEASFHTPKKIAQLHKKINAIDKIRYDLPDAINHKERLSKELYERIHRLRGMLANHSEDTLLFTLSYRTSQKNILDFRQSLQQRIQTCNKKNEKIMLKEIYYKVAFAYQQKVKNQPFSDLYIFCHQNEIPFLTKRDFNVLKEGNLKSALHNHKFHTNKPEKNNIFNCLFKPLMHDDNQD